MFLSFRVDATQGVASALVRNTDSRASPQTYRGPISVRGAWYCVLTRLPGGSGDGHQGLRTTDSDHVRGTPTHTPSSLIGSSVYSEVRGQDF